MIGNRNDRRLRRARQTRLKIRELRTNRLLVYRSNAHIYASITDASGATVLVTASTVESGVKGGVNGNGGNISAASAVGKAIAEKALKAGIEQVAFDRSGYRYHGRVRALAEAAREAGLKF
ncbi:MAG: 50S ribosomal protein L18 [Burkholderiaceae bacterium]